MKGLPDMKKTDKPNLSSPEVPEGFTRAIRRALIRNAFSSKGDNVIKLGRAFNYLSTSSDKGVDSESGTIVRFRHTMHAPNEQDENEKEK